MDRWIKMQFGRKVGLNPSDIVLDGEPAPLPKRDSPQFSAHVYCGETAAWIKMPLGMELLLGLGHIVLDADPAPSPQKWGTAPPIFGPCLLCPNGCINKMPLGTKVGLVPGRIVLHGDPAPPAKRGTAPSPKIFGPCLFWPNGHPSQQLCANSWRSGVKGRLRSIV